MGQTYYSNELMTLNSLVFLNKKIRKQRY